MAITVGLLIPALFVFGVLAVDVGNWFVHKRELQTQADAGALAGAAYYKYPCSDAPISAAAQSYAGTNHNAFANVPATRTTFLLNQPNFSGQAAPGDSGLTGSPCSDLAVDVKMTEKNVPWMFPILKLGQLFKFDQLFTPFINAQARVSIRRLDQLNGLLPVGVPVPDPKRVRVTFISEITGETLGYRDLCQETTPAGGLQIWDNASTNAAGWNGSSCNSATPASSLPLTFNDPKYAKVGVRVQISGSPTLIDCGQPLVSCYDAGSANGAAFVHGWSDQPAVTNTGNSAPQARSVILLPGTCGDAYFSAQSGACTIGLRAAVDFQPREYDASGNPRTSGNNSVIGVAAVVGSSSYQLSWDSTTKTWQTSSINVPAGAGPLDVKLTWSQTDNTVNSTACTKPKPCTNTTDVIQRTFSASDARSGPIKLLQIGNVNYTSGVNDVQMCSTTQTSCTTSFVVRVGIGGSLALSQPTDPPTLLRVADGSQTQAIDCDPNIPNLKDEIVQGCSPSYGRNTGQACPDHAQNASQPSGTSWYCVWTQTGSSNQVADGLNQRIDKGTTCTAPNHWPNYAPGDPRIVPVVVVPYGSFAGSGNASFPIQDFAFFYVTGWSGSGSHADPCAGQGDEIPANNGDLYGHFIKYIEPNDNGGSSGTPCDLSSLSGCVAVMTR
jgi:hypothetical protein